MSSSEVKRILQAQGEEKSTLYIQCYLFVLWAWLRIRGVSPFLPIVVYVLIVACVRLIHHSNAWYVVADRSFALFFIEDACIFVSECRYTIDGDKCRFEDTASRYPISLIPTQAKKTILSINSHIWFISIIRRFHMMTKHCLAYVIFSNWSTTVILRRFHVTFHHR